MPNKNHAALKKDLQDEPILVSADVDHDVATDEIGRRIVRLEISEYLPVCLLGTLVSGIEGRAGVRMLFPELAEPSAADDTHANDPRGFTEAIHLGYSLLVSKTQPEHPSRLP
jgi:hypothetical protein